MTKLKTTAGRRSGSRAGRWSVKARLTTTFIVDASGGALPKGAARLTFTAPSGAAKVLAGKPAKVKPLLQRYGEAFEKSREEGRSVSFRVDVGPDGNATVTPVEEAAAEIEAFPVEEPAEPGAELKDALAAARQRGRLRAVEILSGGEMLSADAFAEVLGTTRMTVNTKRRNGQLLGLDGARRGFRFPIWQLGTEGKPYPELPELLERLGGTWAVYRFLVQPQSALDGLTGREALEQGKGRAAVAAAEGVARSDFR